VRLRHWTYTVPLRLRSIFRRDAVERELDEELQFHLDQLIAQQMAEGKSKTQARRLALLAMDGVEQQKESCRDTRRLNWLDTTFRDIRYSLRGFRRSSGLAIAAVLTLAIGIGGDTAMFSVIRGVLLQPLAYPAPNRLLHLAMVNPDDPTEEQRFTLQRIEEVRTQADSVVDIAAYAASVEDFSFSGDGEPEVLKGARVSASFLDVLGTRPLFGRGFLPEEGVDGGSAVAMVSSAFWHRHFGRDDALPAEPVRMNAVPYTIVGVLPDGFAFPDESVDVWVTRPWQSAFLQPRFQRCCAPLLGIARLKDGMSLDQAQSELDVLNARHAGANSARAAAGPLRVKLLQEHLTGDVETILWLLWAAVGFVLLIACANVASLLMSRARARTHELATRAALGASRRRLVRQLMTESVMLATAGGSAGVLVAWLVVQALSDGSLVEIPLAAEVRLDAVVLGCTAALSVLAGVMFGLLSAVQVVRPSLVGFLRQGGAASSEYHGGRGFLGVGSRGLLVVGQVALSVVLLVGATLMLRSLSRIGECRSGVSAGRCPHDADSIARSAL
jgi:predicted permease